MTTYPGQAVCLISRGLSLVRAKGRLAGVLMLLPCSGSSTSRGGSRSVGLSSENAVTRNTAAAAASAAPAAAAATVGVVEVDERGHLPLGILQHGTVVVLERNARIHRPLSLNVAPTNGCCSRLFLREHGGNVVRRLLHLRGLSHGGKWLDDGTVSHLKR